MSHLDMLFTLSSTQISQEGIKWTKAAKEEVRYYCLIYKLWTPSYLIQKVLVVYIKTNLAKVSMGWNTFFRSIFIKWLRFWQISVDSPKNFYYIKSHSFLHIFGTTANYYLGNYNVGYQNSFAGFHLLQKNFLKMPEKFTTDLCA